MFLLLLLSLAVVVVAFYCILPIFYARVPDLYGKKGSLLYRRCLKHLESLKSVYRPPWWAYNGTVHTVAASFKTEPKLPWCREIVTLPDGGVVALDWLHPSTGRPDTPIVIMFPGITGHTHAGSYLWNPAKEAFEKRWRVLVINRRGLGTRLETPKIAGADNSDDVEFVLEKYVVSTYPEAKKIGLGFSMGGMILINFLTSRGKDKPLVFDYAMSVSSPFDSFASARSMSGTFPTYTLDLAVARSLVNTIQPYRDLLKSHIDFENACSSTKIGEFENRCTAPLNGFRDVNHYYIHTATYEKIDKIPIPFLVLTSEDDYFVPIKWFPLKEFEKNENTVCVVTANGGHTGFMETDIQSRGFAERVFFEWADMHIEGRD